MSRHLMDPDPDAPDLSLCHSLWIIAAVLAFTVLVMLVAQG